MLPFFLVLSPKILFIAYRLRMKVVPSLLTEAQNLWLCRVNRFEDSYTHHDSSEPRHHHHQFFFTRNYFTLQYESEVRYQHPYLSKGWGYMHINLSESFHLSHRIVPLGMTSVIFLNCILPSFRILHSTSHTVFPSSIHAPSSRSFLPQSVWSSLPPSPTPQDHTRGSEPQLGR